MKCCGFYGTLVYELIGKDNDHARADVDLSVSSEVLPHFDPRPPAEVFTFVINPIFFIFFRNLIKCK